MSQLDSGTRFGAPRPISGRTHTCYPPLILCFDATFLLVAVRQLGVSHSYPWHNGGNGKLFRLLLLRGWLRG
jgi:hypothetical protein